MSPATISIWKATNQRQRKERESNPQDITGRSAAFEAAAIASWLALPYFPSKLRSKDSNLNRLVNSQPFYL